MQGQEGSSVTSALRVLMVHSPVGVNVGDSRLALECRALAAEGHSVRALARVVPEMAMRPNKVQAPAFSEGTKTGPLKLDQVLSEFKPDVVHIQDAPASLISSVVRICDKRRIATVLNVFESTLQTQERPTARELRSLESTLNQVNFLLPADESVMRRLRAAGMPDYQIQVWRGLAEQMDGVQVLESSYRKALLGRYYLNKELPWG